MKKLVLFILLLFVCTGVAAQECYSVRLKNGIAQYERGNYRQAIALFQSAQNCPDKPANGTAELNGWIEKCNNPAPARQDVLSVSPANLIFTSSEGYGVISVRASGSWSVEDLPQWCSIAEQTASSLRIRYDQNYTQNSRSGSFRITMGRLNRTVNVEQEASEKEPSGRVLFRSNVSHALADFGVGEQPRSISSPIELKEGEYRVRITKENYYPIDTLVIVPGDGTANIIDIELKPQFSLVRLAVESADEFPIKSHPHVTVGGKIISLAFPDESSVAEAQRVELFKPYKDGFIPMPVGSHDIYVSLENFRDYSSKIDVEQGHSNVHTVILKPISGYLSITDKGNSSGATVFLGDREIGTVPIFKKEVPTGRHIIRFEKDGFLADVGSQTITIEEGGEIDYLLSMSRFKEYEVKSSPAGAEVFLNDTKIGYTPLVTPLLEGQNTIAIKLAGYGDQRRNVFVDRASDQDLIFDFNLEPVHPIKILSEKGDLQFTLTGRNDTITAITPQEFLLPFGEYRIKPKGDKIKRYSLRVKHNSDDDEVVLPIYSRGTFTALAGTYYLTKPKLKTRFDNGTSAEYYNLMADIDLGQFNIAPGLSTSILRASVFQVNKAFKGTIIDSELNEEGMEYSNYMFSASCLLINGEFRVGGYFYRRLGVAALVSYAWNPDLSKTLSTSMISGNEGFFGVEVMSRIPNFNANIRIGQSFYSGKYHFVSKSGEFKQSTPFKMSAFTISVGFTLGQQMTKGNNMLIVW